MSLFQNLLYGKCFHFIFQIHLTLKCFQAFFLALIIHKIVTLQLDRSQGIFILILPIGKFLSSFRNFTPLLNTHKLSQFIMLCFLQFFKLNFRKIYFFTIYNFSLFNWTKSALTFPLTISFLIFATLLISSLFFLILKNSVLQVNLGSYFF